MNSATRPSFADPPSPDPEAVITGLRREIAQRVKVVYEEKSAVDPTITQEMLGKALGLSKSGVNHLLSGRSPLSVAHAHVLARLLKVDIREIVSPELGLDAGDDYLARAQPAGFIDPSVLDRVGKVVRRDYDFDPITEEVRFAYARGAAAMITSPSPSDFEIEAAVRKYVVSLTRPGNSAV